MTRGSAAQSCVPDFAGTGDGAGSSRLFCSSPAGSMVRSISCARLTLVACSTCLRISSSSASRIIWSRLPWNSRAMARALPTQMPTVRMTRGRSLGPITTSATTAITANSDQAKSNIAAYHRDFSLPSRPAGTAGARDNGRSGSGPQTRPARDGTSSAFRIWNCARACLALRRGGLVALLGDRLRFFRLVLALRRVFALVLGLLRGRQRGRLRESEVRARADQAGGLELLDARQVALVAEAEMHQELLG